MVIRRLQIFSWIIAIAFLALFFGIWAQHNVNKSKQEQITLTSGTLLPQPRSVQPFELTTMNNQPFTNANFKNHWTIIFFGFTHCPMICPTTLSVLNKTYLKLQHDQVETLPQVLFVSVDPERDSLKQIKEYLASFNSAFIGTRGEKPQIDALTQQFNVVYAKVMQNTTDENYNVEHSGTILLVDPAGRLHAIFTAPHDANVLASDYEKIVM